MSKHKNIAIMGVGVIGIPVLTDILTELSHEFSITVYSFIPIEKESVPKGIRVRSLPRRIHMRLKYLILGFLILRDHIRNPFHVFHAQSAFPAGVLLRVVAKWLSVPWMLTLIGGEVESIPHVPFGDLLNNRLQGITKKVCTEASILTVMSAFHAASVRSNLNLNRDIKVLPYAPKVNSLESKNISLPLRLLHIATHHPVKNHDMLLSTVAILVETVPFELVIIGNNYGEEFVNKVNQKKLDSVINLVGPQPYDAIEKYCREAHILLHTSWYEGLPTVAFEAMAHGAVVCGTHVGIMADHAGEFCLTVKPGDDRELASKVLQLVNHPEEYQSFRNKAYHWALKNGLDCYVRRITKYYYDLIFNNSAKG